MTPSDPALPRASARPYRGDDDFWAVRRLLVETYPITPTGFNWDIRRWDGWRFYEANPAWNPRRAEGFRVWEADGGRVVGLVHPEYPGGAALQLHPDYRHLQGEMIDWAEGNLTAASPDGAQRQLSIVVNEYDLPRLLLLEQRGYEKTADYEVMRRMRFGRWPLEQPEVAAGYTLRTTRPGDDGDCQRIADLLNAAFRRTFHNAAEYRVFTQMAPSYRNALDLVAVAPDGTFAAYVGIPYDEDNRSGIFEPVCTHPDHRRKGLARALMLEGLRRLKAMGALDATVGTGDMAPASQLYNSIGFSEIYRGYIWRRALPAAQA